MKKIRFLCFAVLALSIAGVSSVQAQDKIPLWSSVDVQFYGFIKLDAAYDTQRSYPGNFVQWVESDVTNTNDDQFSMTANQTRLAPAPAPSKPPVSWKLTFMVKEWRKTNRI